MQRSGTRDKRAARHFRQFSSQMQRAGERSATATIRSLRSSAH
jgi:hypothetical protein